MSEETSLVSVLLAGVVALAGVVTFLYRRVQSQADQSAQEARTQSERNAELAERVGRMEGRQEGIEDLAKEALHAVRTAKKCWYAPPDEADKERPK